MKYVQFSNFDFDYVYSFNEFHIMLIISMKQINILKFMEITVYIF